MRIALINPLSGYKTGSIPLGEGYLASMLKSKGHEVKILDRVPLYYYKYNRDIESTNKEIIKNLENYRPDIIGLTISTAQFYDAKILAKTIKKSKRLDKSILIAGGYHVTAEPQLTLEQIKEVDVGVVGEAEETICEIASKVEIEDIAGLIYRENGRLSRTKPRETLNNLDRIPFPERGAFDSEFYFSAKTDVVSGYLTKAATQITSRGCPARCKFCASELINQSVRFHSSDYIMSEIDNVLRNLNIETISFVDTMFITKWRRVEELCNKIIKSKLNKRLKWAASVRADYINEDKLKLMKQAGCVYLNFGFESGSQRMLDLMKKKISVEKNFEAARLCKNIGIKCNSAFIVGLPGEQVEDIQKTASFIKKANLFNSGINILAPLPGSTYFKEFIEKGILSYSDEQLWEKAGAIFNENIPREDMYIFNDIPKEEFFELIDSINQEIIYIRNTWNTLKASWRKRPVDSLFEWIKFLKKLLLKRIH